MPADLIPGLAAKSDKRLQETVYGTTDSRLCFHQMFYIFFGLWTTIRHMEVRFLKDILLPPCNTPHDPRSKK